MVIKDKYGHKTGMVEEHNGNYIIRDEHGVKTGTAEKKLLSADYDLYDKYGERVGCTDSDVIGKGTTVRDTKGRALARVEPRANMSDGMLIAILAAGILIFLSFKKIPEHLGAAFTEFGADFIVITFPVVVFLIINIIMLVRQKGYLYQYADSYGATFLLEIICGVALYLCAVILLFLEGVIIEGVGFLEALFFSLIAVVIYAASYLVLLLPLSFLFAALIKK